MAASHNGRRSDVELARSYLGVEGRRERAADSRAVAERRPSHQKGCEGVRLANPHCG
jgi:hypothetical protein